MGKLVSSNSYVRTRKKKKQTRKSVTKFGGLVFSNQVGSNNEISTLVSPHRVDNLIDDFCLLRFTGYI